MLENYARYYKLRVMGNSFESWKIISKMLGKVMGPWNFLGKNLWTP